jgi:tellurite resistance protein
LIDPKIFSGENQKYENFFKQTLDLEGFSSLEGFMNEISSIDNTKKIKVICAASLKED